MLIFQTNNSIFLKIKKKIKYIDPSKLKNMEGFEAKALWRYVQHLKLNNLRNHKNFCVKIIKL